MSRIQTKYPLNYRRIFIYVMILSVVIVVASYTYWRVSVEKGYFDRANIYLEQARLEIEQEKEKADLVKEKELRLDLCISAAKKHAWEQWELNCTGTFVYGEDGEVESCSVPKPIGESIHSQEQQSIDNCFKRFSSSN